MICTETCKKGTASVDEMQWNASSLTGRLNWFVAGTCNSQMQELVVNTHSMQMKTCSPFITARDHRN